MGAEGDGPRSEGGQHPGQPAGVERHQGVLQAPREPARRPPAGAEEREEHAGAQAGEQALHGGLLRAAVWQVPGQRGPGRRLRGALQRHPGGRQEDRPPGDLHAHPGGVAR